MTELKIGGNNVGKIMYGGQEFGGATKLEPGTILYMSNFLEPQKNLEDVHLLNTTKNWSNINGINISGYYSDSGPLADKAFDLEIPSDDFKNLDIAKKYKKLGRWNMNVWAITKCWYNELDWHNGTLRQKSVAIHTGSFNFRVATL